MGGIVHFEIPADDVERASRSSRDAFGWSVARWDGPSEYWTVSTPRRARRASAAGS